MPAVAEVVVEVAMRVCIFGRMVTVGPLDVATAAAVVAVAAAAAAAVAVAATPALWRRLLPTQR